MAEVNPEKYKSNSYRSKAEAEEKKANEKVIKGSAKIHQKTTGEKLKETLFGEGVDNVGDYVVFDVIVPTLKEMVVNSVSDGINMLLFGETKRGRSSSRNNRSGYVQYESYSRNRDRDSGRRAQFDFSDIEFETRADAIDVLDAIEDTISMYDVASVSDLYEFAGITPRPTDNNYGWTSVNTAEILMKRNGSYILSMPRPKPLR